jgi:hypothetical protein
MLSSEFVDGRIDAPVDRDVGDKTRHLRPHDHRDDRGHAEDQRASSGLRSGTQVHRRSVGASALPTQEIAGVSPGREFL